MQPLPPTFIPRKSRVQRKRQAVVTSPPPPGPPILVSASYDPGAVPSPTVTLVFDRAIDVSGYDGTEIILYDEPNGIIYDASAGDALVDAVTLVVQLSPINTDEGSQVLLDANDSTGIVDVVTGEPWAGADNLPLPWP